MTTKHTPGPWQFENQWNGINAIHTPKGELIATLEKHAVRGGTHSVDECNANARLIAAAPDLLAALQDYVSQTTQYINDRTRELPDATRARAAIAKAVQS